jgi:hypothetical protein
MEVIEVMGAVDAQRQLHVNEPLPAMIAPGPVRVIIMAPDRAYGDISEEEWMRAAARNPEFAWLADPAEDIYTMNDGVPFYDDGEDEDEEEDAG